MISDIPHLPDGWDATTMITPKEHSTDAMARRWILRYPTTLRKVDGTLIPVKNYLEHHKIIQKLFLNRDV